ncbi:acyl-CoA N-acyltransferase [Crassisporium funariophilum]|nr:acyl-CoA N-acyltransferase [Crassisporium funariophilum]
MPVPPSNIEVITRAIDLPALARDALEENPINANTILPILNKCVKLDRAGCSPPGHFWVVIYSFTPRKRVLFILACTEGYMGLYPIFIFTPTSSLSLGKNIDAVKPSLHLLAETLARHVPVERVYSIFALRIITLVFADCWTRITGTKALQEPYYDAKISFLRRNEGHDRAATVYMDEKLEIKPADIHDVPAVSRLAYLFAKESPPFTLTPDAATYEAQTLIDHKQVWVLKVNGEVVCIVAFTRNSAKVATISKVYTHPDFRGMKYAERLVRHVCNWLLREKGREAVTLFVGVDNLAAKVYHRVGFEGLDNSPAVEGVDLWLELGFDRSKIVLGHW